MLMKKSNSILKLAVVVTCGSTLSFAAVEIASAAVIKNSSETPLSTILNNPNYGVGNKAGGTSNGSLIDVNNAQSSVERWMNADATASATLVIELAGYLNVNKFGMYKFVGDKLTKILLFDGADKRGDKVTVAFDDNGDIRVSNSTGNIKQNNQLTAGFGNTFGFYLDSPVGTFFTEDSKNGGKEQALVYQGNDKTMKSNLASLSALNNKVFSETDWFLAWEDKIVGDTGSNKADEDYNDMVVLVSGIKEAPVGAVPEPLTILGVGTALGFGSFFRRKVLKTKKKA